MKHRGKGSRHPTTVLANETPGALVRSETPASMQRQIVSKDISNQPTEGRRFAFCAVLAIVAIVAYSRTLYVPLFFDDFPAIRDNPTIRHLADLGAVLSPPSSMVSASGVTGRPLINLSLAINYALGGLNPIGYHAFNVLIHVAATLALFGVLWRTFERAGTDGRMDRLTDPTAAAFAAALLWTVHPLLTESVTCIIQRTESLMGLCYLLTLYSFIRYAGATKGRRTWACVAILCSLLGMATKEVMVTAPVVVLLYDRALVSGSLMEAWRRHGRLHLALAATWLLLAFLVLHAGGSRGSAAGFGFGVSSWDYLLTQCRAIVLYLRLSLWPRHLVVDYGTGLVTSLSQIWSQALFLLALMASVCWAMIARPALGFLGAWFFLILAPSSSVVPLGAQTIAEHRMYLPLASVIVAVTIVVSRGFGRAAVPCCIAFATGLFVATWNRNEIYRSELALWSDTVERQPENERAHNNLGLVLEKVPGRLDDAIAQYREALLLNPNYAEAHENLGNALAKLPGRLKDAIAQCEEAIRLKPEVALTHLDLGSALAQFPGRLDDAIAQFHEALLLQPDNAEAHNNLGSALLNVPGRQDDAIAQFQEALRLKPDYAEAHYNLGNAVLRVHGRMNDAAAHYEQALRLKPNYAEAYNNLGLVHARMPGRMNDALAEFQQAARLNPNLAEAHKNLGDCLLMIPERLNDAIAEYQDALRLNPDSVEVLVNLGHALNAKSRVQEAIAAYEEALRLRPDLVEAHYNLGNTLATVPGRSEDAIVQYETALRLRPDEVVPVGWTGGPSKLIKTFAGRASGLVAVEDRSD